MLHAINSVAALLRRLLAGALLWGVFSGCVFAASASYDILLDTDHNPSTGCTVTTPGGTFPGVERILSTTVDGAPTNSSVTGITLQACASGAFATPTVISNGSWPVGSFARPQTDAVSVVETFMPLAELGEKSTIVRAAVIAKTPDGGDAMLGADLIIQRPTVAPVPTLSPLLLALMAGGIGLGGAWLARRRRASVMVLGVCVMLSVVGMAWAATIAMDGQTSDWSGVQPRMTGNGQNTNLANFWFTHDVQKAYFRIDACSRNEARRGELVQVAAGQPMAYVTRGGNWIIQVDQTTVTVTRSTLCQFATVEMWGHPHENLNGKHIKDWLGDRRTLLLDDGTKITMHADGPHAVIHTMNIYDGPNSIEIDNNNNIVLQESTDPIVAQQREEAEADGETASVKLVPNNAPGGIGHLDFRNHYTQVNPGPAPQCLVSSVDPLCVEQPLGTTGDFYLNPNQVNDLYDDPRLSNT